MSSAVTRPLSRAGMRKAYLVIVGASALVFLVATGLLARYGVEPPTSLVVTASELVVGVQARAGSHAVTIALDPALADGAAETNAPAVRSLHLSGVCDTLKIGVSAPERTRRASGPENGPTIELTAWRHDVANRRLAPCPTGSAKLVTTARPASSTPGRKSRPVTAESPAVFTRPVLGAVLAHVAVTRLVTSPIEKAEIANAEVFGDESLHKRKLIIDARDWELHGLETVAEDGRPLLRASLGSAGTVSTIRLDSDETANLVWGWRGKKWWALFVPIFGVMTVLDLLRMEAFSRWLLRCWPNKQQAPTYKVAQGPSVGPSNDAAPEDPPEVPGV